MIEDLQEEYYPLPQPDEILTREKEDAMAAYLMMFAALGAGLPLPMINLIASVIYYYTNKNKSKFVRFHALQAMFSQVFTSIINAGVVFWLIRIFFYGWKYDNNFKGYLVFAIISNLFYFVFGIIAAIKARKGLFYYFYFFGKLSYDVVFRVKPEKEQKPIVNEPPKF